MGTHKCCSISRRIFCRVFQMRKLDVESGLFSEDDTIARGIPRGATPKSNVGRAVTVSSGLSDLSSVLAEAEAEVDGRSPGPSKKNARSSSARGKSSRSNARKKSGSSKKQQVQESSGGNSNASCWSCGITGGRSYWFLQWVAMRSPLQIQI